MKCNNCGVVESLRPVLWESVGQVEMYCNKCEEVTV